MTTDNAGWPANAAPVATTPPPVDPAMAIIQRNAQIKTWLQLKATAVEAVDCERTARATVTATCFPTPKKGTQRIDIGEGYTLKLVHGLTYSLGDKDKVDEAGLKVTIRSQVAAVENKLIEAFPVEAPLVLDRLIKWVPEISGSEFEKLDRTTPYGSAIGAAIDEILTIKPASPQLEFEAPKVK